MSDVTAIPWSRSTSATCRCGRTASRMRSSSACGARTRCTGARWRPGRTSRASGRSRAPRTSTRSAGGGRTFSSQTRRHRRRATPGRRSSSRRRCSSRWTRRVTTGSRRSSSAGFTPKRIAEHEEEIRAIVDRVLDRLEGREEFDIVADVATPVVSRVIGSFVGTRRVRGRGLVGLRAQGDGVRRRGAAAGRARDRDAADPQGLRGGRQARRRAPRQPDRRPHERARDRRGRRRGPQQRGDHHGLRAAAARRQRQHEGDVLQRHGRAAPEPRASGRSSSTTRRRPRSPSRSCCAGRRRSRTSAAPPPATSRSTASTIREGDKVVLWYPTSNRDETVYQCPHQFDVERNAEHQAFGAGGRHFCLGTALARLELKILLEETATRFPDLELDRRQARLRALALPQPAARGPRPHPQRGPRLSVTRLGERLGEQVDLRRVRRAREEDRARRRPRPRTHRGSRGRSRRR